MLFKACTESFLYVLFLAVSFSDCKTDKRNSGQYLLNKGHFEAALCH